MRVSVVNNIPRQWSRDRMIEIFRLLETQLNLLSEGRLRARHFTATSVPTSGDFARGDIIWNSEPSAGGTVGWICVVAGSPGTLKAFGNIAS